MSSYSCKHDPKHQPRWSNTLHQKSSFGTPWGCTKKNIGKEINSKLWSHKHCIFSPPQKTPEITIHAVPSGAPPLPVQPAHLAQPKTRSLSLAKSPGSWMGFLWQGVDLHIGPGLQGYPPIISHTVDGRNPKQPPEIYKNPVNNGISSIISWCRISSINSMKACNPRTLSTCAAKGWVFSAKWWKDDIWIFHHEIDES